MMPKKESDNVKKANKSAEAAKTVGGQRRSVRSTGKTGQAERDESAIRVSKIHDPKQTNKPWWKS